MIHSKTFHLRPRVQRGWMKSSRELLWWKDSNRNQSKENETVAWIFWMNPSDSINSEEDTSYSTNMSVLVTWELNSLEFYVTQTKYRIFNLRKEHYFHYYLIHTMLWIITSKNQSFAFLCIHMYSQVNLILMHEYIHRCKCFVLTFEHDSDTYVHVQTNGQIYLQT